MTQSTVMEMRDKILKAAMRKWRELVASSIYVITGLGAARLAWGVLGYSDMHSDPWARTVQPVLFSVLLGWAAVGVVRGLDGRMFRPAEKNTKDKPARPAGATLLACWALTSVALFSALLVSSIVARLTIPDVLQAADCRLISECARTTK